MSVNNGTRFKICAQKGLNYLMRKKKNGLYNVQQNQSSGTNVSKKCCCCCFRKQRGPQSILINSKTTDQGDLNSSLFNERDSKKYLSSSSPNDLYSVQPFLNFTTMSQQASSDFPNFRSILVDMPSTIETEKETLVYNRKPPINFTMEESKKESSYYNRYPSTIEQEREMIVYSNYPSYIESSKESLAYPKYSSYIEPSHETLYTANKYTSVKPVQKERIRNVTECRISNDETKPVVSSQSFYEVYTSSSLPDETAPRTDHYRSKRMEEVHGVNTKHCIACLMESMKDLPDCCLKKALYLNPVYISNDCPSKPIYLK